MRDVSEFVLFIVFNCGTLCVFTTLEAFDLEKQCLELIDLVFLWWALWLRYQTSRFNLIINHFIFGFIGSRERSLIDIENSWNNSLCLFFSYIGTHCFESSNPICSICCLNWFCSCFLFPCFQRNFLLFLVMTMH